MKTRIAFERLCIYIKSFFLCPHAIRIMNSVPGSVWWASSISQRAWSRPITVESDKTHSVQRMHESLFVVDSDDEEGQSLCWSSLMRGGRTYQRYFKMKAC